MEPTTVQRPEEIRHIEIPTRVRTSVPAQSWQLTTPSPMLRVTNISPYRPSRREFLIGTAGLLLVPAGCGSDGGDQSDASGQTRTIEHVLGETEVPRQPRRVIAIDPYVTLPTALLLDAPVVGTGYIPAGEPFPPFVDEEKAEGIENIGWLEFNLETMAALEPDLIIGAEGFVVEDVYDELSRIAPTISVSQLDRDWRASVLKVAEVLGQRRQAQREISAFDARVGEFRSATGDGLGEFQVSLVNIREAADIRIYTEPDVASSIMAECGVRRPQWQRQLEDPDTINISLSLELLPRIDTEVIFYYVGSTGGDYEDSQSELERIQENPLWQNLEAVQNDRAYRVDAAHWFGTSSIQAANLILDDLEKYLLQDG